MPNYANGAKKKKQVKPSKDEKNPPKQKSPVDPADMAALIAAVDAVWAAATAPYELQRKQHTKPDPGDEAERCAPHDHCPDKELRRKCVHPLRQVAAVMRRIAHGLAQQLQVFFLQVLRSSAERRSATCNCNLLADLRAYVNVY